MPLRAWAASPVLLALDASVLVPPPNDPSDFCCAASQVLALLTAVVTVFPDCDCSWRMAIAVASVSGSLPSSAPLTHDWLPAVLSAVKFSRK